MDEYSTFIMNIDDFELFDSHIHLSVSEFDSIRDDILNSLKKTKTLAFNVSETLEDSKLTVDLSHYSNNLLSFVGIHPKYSSSNLNEFDKFFTKNIDSIDGVGEIGLDKTYVERGIEFDSQLITFKHMLDLAERHKLPVSIHSRDATQEVLDIVSSYDLPCIILHWFSGTEEQLKKLYNSEILISFGPALVYSKSLQKLAKISNPQRTIVETDGPVPFSACFEGKIAEPSFIPSIIFKLSNLWNMNFDDTSKQLINNLKPYISVKTKSIQ